MTSSTPTPPVAGDGTPPTTPAAPVVPPDVEQLQTKLELVKADKQRLGETNADLNRRLGELERQLRDNEESKLEGQQQYKALWEAAKQTILDLEAKVSTLESDLTTTREGQQREKLKTSALGVMHEGGVIAPAQLYSLMGSEIGEKDGKPVVIQGGIERDLAQVVASLRTPGSGFEHHFFPSGGRGMGTPPAATTASGGNGSSDVNNPWSKAGWNRTGQLAVLRADPAQAEALQKAAGVQTA